jgi:hypothetical protein
MLPDLLLPKTDIISVSIAFTRYLSFNLAMFFSFLLKNSKLNRIQWVLVVKQLRHEADHTSSCNAKFKNAWSYISRLLYVFMVWCLIKQRIWPHDMILS